AGKRAKIGDIVEHSGSPEAFTAKVLGALTKHQIVKSHTGPYGGFDTDVQKMKEIKVSEIVEAIDGDSMSNGCGMEFSECSNVQPCPMHNKFVKVRSEIKKMLTSTTIHDLALGLKSGKTVLIR